MRDAPSAPRPSRRILQYALVSLGALILVVGAAIAYLVATFDPRDYEERIVELVREKTGRTLAIRGRIELSFWPGIAVRLGELTLSERSVETGRASGERAGMPRRLVKTVSPEGEPFLTIESARLTLELVPLLRRELVATELALSGANIRITRYEDGRLNVDDLFKGDGAAPRFEIGKVALARSAVSFRDLGPGKRYELTEIALETGRLANVVTTPVTLAFVAADGADTFRVEAKLEGNLQLDLERERYGLRQASLTLKGRVPGVPDLVAGASGDAAVQMKVGAAQVDAFAASMSGTHGSDAMSVAFEASRLVIVPGEASGVAVRASMTAKGPAGTTGAKLALPAVKRAGDRIESDAAALELALVRGEHTVRAAVSSPLEGAIAAREVALRRIDASFTVLGPRLPRKGIAGSVKGEAHVDAAKEGVQLRLAGKVAESNVKAQLTAAGFAAPVYSFAVHIDELDLDRYVASDTGKAPEPPAKRGENLLLPFANLPATGTLTVGLLKTSNLKAGNVRFVVK